MSLLSLFFFQFSRQLHRSTKHFVWHQNHTLSLAYYCCNVHLLSLVSSIVIHLFDLVLYCTLLLVCPSVYNVLLHLFVLKKVFVLSYSFFLFCVVLVPILYSFAHSVFIRLYVLIINFCLFVVSACTPLLVNFLYFVWMCSFVSLLSCLY